MYCERHEKECQEKVGPFAIDIYPMENVRKMSSTQRIGSRADIMKAQIK